MSHDRALTGPIIKRCPCGALYSLPDWQDLELVGHYPDERPPLELRNCECGSTIALEVEAEDA
jgi:hypothetical protein